MNNNYSGWHVLYVKSQHEKKVDLLLKEAELDSFLPTIETVRQWADRKKKIIVPLFPTYIFINLRTRGEFYKALKINGVFNYVKFGGIITKIRSEEIDRIQKFLNLEGISDVDSSYNIPIKGETMLINYGSLNGLECTVLNINNKNKVYVTIKSINRNITAIVPSIFLTKIKV